MVNSIIYLREVDKEGNLVWHDSNTPEFQKLVISEAPSTSKKRPRVAAPNFDEEAKPSNQLQSMLNQLQIHLDSKFEAI